MEEDPCMFLHAILHGEMHCSHLLVKNPFCVAATASKSFTGFNLISSENVSKKSVSFIYVNLLATKLAFYLSMDSLALCLILYTHLQPTVVFFSGRSMNSHTPKGLRAHILASMASL